MGARADTGGKTTTSPRVTIDPKAAKGCAHPITRQQRRRPWPRLVPMWLCICLGYASASLGGCVETSECRSDGQCAVNQSCHRGYCQDICKTQAEGRNGRKEDVSLRCSRPEDQRCVCVQTVEGNTCSDTEEQVCNPTIDDYCLCFDQNAACNPRCKEPLEACIKGACVRQTDP
jgi:hypothetical protein